MILEWKTRLSKLIPGRVLPMINASAQTFIAILTAFTTGM